MHDICFRAHRHWTLHLQRVKISLECKPVYPLCTLSSTLSKDMLIVNYHTVHYVPLVNNKLIVLCTLTYTNKQKKCNYIFFMVLTPPFYQVIGSNKVSPWTMQLTPLHLLDHYNGVRWRITRHDRAVFLNDN